MVLSVICFGDSNTYGYDPRSFIGDRYSAEHRWVDLLAMKTGWEIRNAGMNGRTVHSCMFSVPKGTRLLMIMLGTNDLLQGRSVDLIVSDMERFLRALTIPLDHVVLIAPPYMTRGEWVVNDELVLRAHALSEALEKLANQKHTLFVDTGAWEIPMCYDGVHFTEEGHRRFAAGLYEYLLKEDVLCLRSV